MLSKFFELESKYELKAVKINDICLWPFLRIYFGYKLIYNTSSVNVDSKSFLKILSSVFYGVFKLFGRYNFLFFSDSEQRREMNGELVDRFDYVISNLGGRSLFFEILFIKKHAGNAVPTKNRTSRSLLYTLEFILIKLLFYKKVKGQAILNQINNDYALNVNWDYHAKRFLAQFLIGKFLARVYKPKAIFFITPYTNLGYLVGFKYAGIKVIEMQHGIINSQHLGYNPSVDFGDYYRPDYLLTFGEKEKKVFSGRNSYIDNTKVYSVGNFYFDYLINEYKGDDTLTRLAKGYSKVVAVSAEFDVEREIIPFINKVACKSKDVLFLYMPRFKKASDYKEYQLESNIIVTDWLNSYQVMRLADFHSCVRSTTALEAVALGTQNILINLKNYSTFYFKDLLLDTRVTQFVNSEEEYLEALTTFRLLPKEEVMKSKDNAIELNFKSSLKTVLSKIMDK